MGNKNKILLIFKRDIAIFICNLAINIIVARKFGPNVLSVWMILTLMLSYFESIFRTKSDFASVQLLSSGKYTKEDIFLNLSFITFIAFIIFSIFFIFSFDLIYKFFFKSLNDDFKIELYSISVIFLFSMIHINFTYFFQGIKNITIYNNIKIVQPLSFIIFFCGFYLIKLFPPIWILISSLLFSYLIAILFSFFWYSKIVNYFGSFNLKLIGHLLKNSSGFYIAGIFSQIYEHGIKLILINSYTAYNFMYFNQAQGLGRLILKVPDAINVILYPHLSSIKRDHRFESISSAFRLAFIVLFFICFLSALVIKEIIFIFYGFAYMSTVTYFYILLPVVFFTSLCTFLQTDFNASEKSYKVPIYQAPPLIFSLLILSFFVDFLDFNQIVISYSILNVLSSFYFIYKYLRFHQYSFLSFFPKVNDFIILFDYFYNRFLNFKKLFNS